MQNTYAENVELIGTELPLPQKVTYFATLADLEAYLGVMSTMQCEVAGLSELDHGLQTAYELKLAVPDDRVLQIAGLLHDVAHQQCHIRDHEAFGANMVRDIMPERVLALIIMHAEAKRYLVTTNPAYYDKLSPTSRASFEAQGGIMSDAEVAKFEASPYRDDAIKLRWADDLAKTPGRIVPGLAHWIDDLRMVAAQTARINA